MQCSCAILPSVACPALQYCSTLSHKWHDFRKKKKLLNTKCVLIFDWQISHSKNNWEIYDQKRILAFMQSARYSCSSLMKLEFSQQIFEKRINTKFHDNPSSGSRVVPCRQTDRHDSANSHFSQFCAPKNKARTITWKKNINNVQLLLSCWLQHSRTWRVLSECVSKHCHSIVISN
jgi:hypothetical protein